MKKIKELQGANMDIDLTSENVAWNQSVCPWNEADNTTEHKCAVNMDTRIFMAKENDFETVKDITQTTIKLVYPKYYPEGAVQFFCNHHADDRILNDIAAGKVYLLEVDDVCVGTVTISNNEICRLFVLPEYQHKGYGRLLMDYAEKMISKTNKTVVLDASFPAKKIYIKRGYEPTEYNMIETENGDYLCFDVMEKSI